MSVHPGAFVALVAVIVMVASCTSNGDSNIPSTELQAAVGVNAGDIVGTCVKFAPDQDATVEEFTTISCDEEHTHEIYAVTTLGTDDLYPGFAELEDLARLSCLDKFEQYVGVGPFDSVFFYTWLVPTLASWNDSGTNDRDILCMLGPRGGGPTTGSQKAFVGRCLDNFEPGADDTIVELSTVDCAVQHTHEIYLAVPAVSDGDAATASTPIEEPAEICEEAFNAYVGTSRPNANLPHEFAPINDDKLTRLAGLCVLGSTTIGSRQAPR